MSDEPNGIMFEPEAEEAVLGAVMSNPNANYHAVAALIEDDNDFFLLRNRWIWQAMRRCMERDNGFDYLTIASELERIGKLEEIGGKAYLVRLANTTPNTTLAEQYAQLVRRVAIRRNILSAAEAIQKTAMDGSISTDMVVENVEREIFGAIAKGANRRTVSMAEAASAYFERVSNIQKGGQDALGIPTGFADLDALTYGAQRGQLIYVAGRPGMGKSAFLTSIAAYAARAHKQRVFFWTGEMNTEEVFGRFLSAEAEINGGTLQSGQMSPEQLSRFAEVSLKRIPEWPIWIDDTAGITVETLRSMCLRHSMIYGLDMIVVDYIGLLRTSVRTQNRTNEMGEISRSLKRLAAELRVPVLCAAQLNRGLENRPNKRPILSDLRDSGDLEQDASKVIFLYRDEVYDENTEHKGIAEVIVAKHRNGPTGNALLRFEAPYTRFAPANMRQVNLRDRT